MRLLFSCIHAGMFTEFISLAVIMTDLHAASLSKIAQRTRARMRTAKMSLIEQIWPQAVDYSGYRDSHGAGSELHQCRDSRSHH